MTNKTDIIFIQQLKIATTIGIHDWERQIKQIVLIDLEIKTNFQQAASTDDINYTLDYQYISEQLSTFITNSSFKLIETLATAAANFLLEKFPITDIKITLRKPGALANSNCVGVIIERTKTKSPMS